MANKAKRIRDLLGLRQLDVEFCRKDLLASHPMAWLVEVEVESARNGTGTRRNSSQA